MKHFLKFILLLAVSFIFIQNETGAQYFKLKGTVYDSTRTYPLAAVSVLSTSGRGTFTNSSGQYVIEVKETDSVWFSYLNKPTIKYAVAKIYNSEQFDLAIHVSVPLLKEVVIRPRNYRLDSLQNRIDYAKVFNWEKPGLRASVGSGIGTSVGFDLQEIIRMFQFRRNKSMEKFRERLLLQERDKYIDYRFNKALVLRLTGLSGEERDSFMLRCRPSYEFCMTTGDYEFQSWIKNCYAAWLAEKNNNWLKKED